VWLKVVTFVPWQGKDIWVRNDYLLGRPVQRESISTKIARQRANEWGFSEILACALLRDFHHSAGKADSRRWDLFRVVLRAQSQLLPICRLLARNNFRLARHPGEITV
jgi:hypothetical protein